jgi:predicted nucleotidyltransferase
MRSQTTTVTIEEIHDRLEPLCHDAGLQLIVLFGSLAKGQRNLRSDVDLAFLYDVPFNNVQLTNRVSQLLRSDAIDVVDLRTASPLLKFSAMRDGKVLYERSSGMFSSFYSLAFRRYIDTKKLRDAQRAAVRNYIAGQVRT